MLGSHAPTHVVHPGDEEVGMRIRAIVQIHEKRNTSYNPQDTVVIMHPIHAGAKIPEAEQFSTATPSGTIELTMKNKVAELFPLGKYADVTFDVRDEL